MWGFIGEYYQHRNCVEICNKIHKLCLSFVLGKLYKHAQHVCIHGEIVTLKFNIQQQMPIESFLIYNLLCLNDCLSVVYQAQIATMVLTAAQMTAFFEDNAQMGITHDTVIQCRMKES